MSKRTPPEPGAPGAAGRRDWRLLALGTLLPAVALFLLFGLDVPLGKPEQFVYLYSPIVTRRLAALPTAILLAAVLAGSVWLTFAPHRMRRALGFVLLSLATIGLTAWTYVAPPEFRSQHFFNMQSPSHDGAFLTEAGHLRRVGVKNYLSDFPRRARTPPEHMRGTRVISNPPATTLLAAGTISLLERSPRLERWLSTLTADEELPPETGQLVTQSLSFAGVLLLLWLLATPLLYAAGRLFLPGPTAAAFAVLCLFSPMTLLFAPGKDPAQLLTVALPLWLWLLAWRHERSWAALLAGAALVVACLASLVHVWIAAIVLAACALNTARAGLWRFTLRICLPAVCGALAVIVALALLGDLNSVATAWAAAGAQAEITRGEGAMPFAWQTLGIPLFLLFAGPALWCLGLWLPRRLRDREARFGLCLLLGAAVVMLATVGFTNVETPRLWIPFTPLLLLGGALQLPAFRQPTRRAALLLAVLVFVQLGTAAAQWSLMDAREAETRLLRTADTDPRLFE